MLPCRWRSMLQPGPADLKKDLRSDFSATFSSYRLIKTSLVYDLKLDFCCWATSSSLYQRIFSFLSAQMCSMPSGAYAWKISCRGDLMVRTIAVLQYWHMALTSPLLFWHPFTSFPQLTQYHVYSFHSWFFAMPFFFASHFTRLLPAVPEAGSGASDVRSSPGPG